MSDLVKRLRVNSSLSEADQDEAADRIESLERVLMQAREALDNMTKHFCLSRLASSTLADSEARVNAHKASAAIDAALHTEVSEKR